jgi:diaminopimelate epimerase
MSGSGNDFVFFDARPAGAPSDVTAAAVAAVCARGTGVGADGLVVFDQPSPGRVRITYYNGDGSRAALCGNATLCAASLARHLGAVAPNVPFRIETDAGELDAIAPADEDPSFELAPVQSVRPDLVDAPAGEGQAAEQRLGYAVAGVPHVVVLVADVDAVALAARSPVLRRPTVDRPGGANVNYVSRADSGAWRMRTFERGVEGETLACGTGAVACAALLHAWGEAAAEVSLLTRSGRPLRVSLPPPGVRGPRLSGEGRLVFTGKLVTLGP